MKCKASVLSLILGLLWPSFLVAGGQHGDRIMPDAEAAFREVQQHILDDYVDADISEDVLWTGAMEGMLRRLIQLEGMEINTILSPADMEKLEEGLKGKFFGVGVVIKQVEDLLIIQGIMPGGAAEKATLQEHDRILRIDGAPVKGLDLWTIVSKIRGLEGTTVTLLVQRDEKEWEVPLERVEVKVEPIFGQVLEGDVGYLRVRSFTNNTEEALTSTLKRLESQGVKRLVMDVRDCPGGLLDSAVSMIGHFLPRGAVITTTRGRSAEHTKELKAKRGRKVAWPVVVLMDEGTSSGAEILAGALSDHGRALLVGEQTLGKGTVETIVELKNGWGLKLSVARFYSPKGENWQGVGLVPDFEVASSLEEKRPWGKDEPDLKRDSQLKAAVSLLRMQGN